MKFFRSETSSGKVVCTYVWKTSVNKVSKSVHNYPSQAVRVQNTIRPSTRSAPEINPADRPACAADACASRKNAGNVKNERKRKRVIELNAIASSYTSPPRGGEVARAPFSRHSGAMRSIEPGTQGRQPALAPSFRVRPPATPE